MNKGNYTVLLVNPPADHLAGMDSEKANIKATDFQCYPPIGILYLAAQLKRDYPALRVIVKDYVVEKYDRKSFVDLLVKEKPFIVGITVFSVMLYDAIGIARIVKETDNSIAVVAGGPHSAIYSRNTMEQACIDYVCQGEGEKAFSTLVDHIFNGKLCAGIDNIWTKDGKSIVPPARCNIIAYENLEESPVIDYSLVEPKRYYHPFLHQGAGLINILSGRGCPFKCTFCNTAEKVYRPRKIQSVIDEITANIDRFNIKNVYIMDDTFNITKARIEEFAQALIAKNMRISWAFRGRIETLDDSVLAIAKKSGLRHIALGVEDFTDEGMQIIKKGTSIKKVKEVFSACRKHGVFTTANFIIGFPHNQDWNKQMRLAELIDELKPTTIQTGVLTLMPGSKIYDEALAQGIIKGTEWEDHANNPSPSFVMPGWNGAMSVDDQFKINSIINKRFYGRPGYLLKRLFEVRSMRELVIKARAGFNLLGSFVRQGKRH